MNNDSQMVRVRASKTTLARCPKFVSVVGKCRCFGRREIFQNFLVLITSRLVDEKIFQVYLKKFLVRPKTIFAPAPMHPLSSTSGSCSREGGACSREGGGCSRDDAVTSTQTGVYSFEKSFLLSQQRCLLEQMDGLLETWCG